MNKIAIKKEKATQLQKIAAGLCLFGSALCLVYLLMGVMPFISNNMDLGAVIDETLVVLRAVTDLISVFFKETSMVKYAWGNLMDVGDIALFCIAYYVVLGICIKKVVNCAFALKNVLAKTVEEKMRKSELKQALLSFNTATLTFLLLLCVSTLIAAANVNTLSLVLLILLAAVHIGVNALAIFSVKVNFLESAAVAVSRAVLLFLLPVLAVHLSSIDTRAVKAFFRFIFLAIEVILLIILMNHARALIQSDKYAEGSGNVQIRIVGFIILAAAFYVLYFVDTFIIDTVRDTAELWYILKHLLPTAGLIAVEALAAENANVQAVDAVFEEETEGPAASTTEEGEMPTAEDPMEEKAESGAKSEENSVEEK